MSLYTPETPLHRWLSVDDVADYFADNLASTSDADIDTALARVASWYKLSANFGADPDDARYRADNYDVLAAELREKVAAGDIAPAMPEQPEPVADTGRDALRANHPAYNPVVRTEMYGEDAAVSWFGAEKVREAFGGELPSEKEAREAAEAEAASAEEAESADAEGTPTSDDD